MTTAKDVAASLGLSVSTVGRALSDDPRISAETKARVVRGAEAMGYVANRAARMMRGASSDIVGVVVPDISNGFYATIAHALSETLARNRYQLMLGETADDPTAELRQARGFVAAQVAGAIIVPTARPAPETVRLLGALPHVQLLRNVTSLGPQWFGIDDDRSLRMATEHLIGLGHRRIAFVGGTADLPTGAARRRGYREALAAAGLAVDPAMLEIGPPSSIRHGRDAVARLLDRVREHQPAAILTCWAPVSAVAIGASPDLRVVARMGVGLDNIDVAAATEHGVLVTNVPDYCVAEVSDHAVAMILAWTRGLVSADSAVHAGRWLRRLGALTCGIVGYGRIGRETARKLAAFGCRVLVTDPHPPADPGPVELVALDTLLGASDVVVLHAPLTPETRGLIGAPQLARMRPGGLLVNVSRGGLVDTAAVVDALASGQLGGAALDVLDSEPEVPAGLLAQEGAVITPHIAFSSDLSLLDLRRSAAEEVVRVLRGEPPRHPRNTVEASA